MRQIRVLSPRGLLHGSRHYAQGAVVEVQDDRLAARIVELKHAEFLAAVPAPRPVERAEAPKAAERAVARGGR